MDKRTRARQLLAELGETLSLGQLSLDDTTPSCTLMFDDKLVLDIDFEEDSGRFLLSCELGKLPAENAESLLRELLAADLFWHRTAGATLALEEDTDAVVLSQAQEVAEVDRPGFEKLVEGFLDQAEKWARRIASSPVAEEQADSDVGAGNAQLMIFG